MTIKIIPNEKGNPPGKLADAELHFDAGHGVLAGLKLIGFAIWERRTGAGRNVTFGSVFLCRHTETGEGAAIKTLQVEPLSNPQQRDAMLREAELWASLPLHPNVVSCDFLFNSVQDHRLWLGMERVDGDPVRGATLWEWTTGEPLDVERLVRVVGGICAAMQHVANANMVHRDLKPGNVLLTPEGFAKVTDFGIAQPIEPMALRPRHCNISRRRVGTERFPRLRHGMCTHLEFSYGNCLPGRRPFADCHDQMSLFLAHTTYQPADLREIDPSADPTLATIAQMCLSKSAEARPTFASLIDQLRSEWPSITWSGPA